MMISAASPLPGVRGWIRSSVHLAIIVLVLALGGSELLRAQDAPEPVPEAVAPTIGLRAASASASGTVQQRYAAGLAAYERGDFEGAAEIFRALVGDGHAEPAILLAMGNSAYRRELPIEAVYAYEWARRLAPRDVDVAANLERARTRLVRDELPTDGSEAARRFRDVLRMIPTAWTALGFSILWVVGWAVLALRQRSGRPGLGAVAVGCILLAVPLAAHVAFRLHDARAVESGILQAHQAEIHSGPGESYATLFTLHAGTVVDVGERRGGWCRVLLPQGSEGWLPTSAVAIFGRIETLETH